MKREITNYLIKWKESENRKPLIIHGARQVGKTYIVKEFGKEFYENIIYVNFETNKELSAQIEDSIDAKYIINKLELFFGEKITPGKTLIFFDEIQKHFESNKKIDKDIHELCLKLYRTYLVVGGMPEVIQIYLDEKKTISAIDVQTEILESYERDMTKYADNSLSNRIISAFDSIPVQLAKDNQKFQYKVISKGSTSSIFREAILWLKNSGIVNQIYKANAELPLEMHKDLASFKLYMSDVGLFVNKARYPLYQIDLSVQPTMISMGPLTEHYVANELRKKGYDSYYWESDGIAELDFIIQKEMDIIPIEVKSSIHTKSRSLDLYIKKYKPKYAIRISEKNFGYENNIKSVPLYAVFCI